MRAYDNVETMLAFHGAPTLEGIKPGSLISFSKKRIKNCQRILRQYKICMECKGIYFFVLSETENWLLLFIYRKNSLEQLLKNREVQDFLAFYGYENCRNLKPLSASSENQDGAAKRFSARNRRVFGLSAGRCKRIY